MSPCRLGGSVAGAGGEVPAGVQEFPRVEMMPVFHAAGRQLARGT